MSEEGFFAVPRRTELWLNLPNAALDRKPWFHAKSAKQIQPQRVTYSKFFGGLFNSGNVLFTGDAWIMTPWGHELPDQFQTQGDFHVQAGDVNLAPNHRVYETYRRTTVPGAGQAPGLLMTGAPAFQRRRAAGSLLSTGNLDADKIAVASPAPVPDPELIPTDRVLSGIVTYPANQPFLLGFQTVTGAAEDVATFQFGGPAEVFPHAESGGQFSVRLKASGRAILYEWDAELVAADKWKPVWEFVWKHGHASGDFNGLIENNTLWLVPYARNRLACYNLGAGYAGPVNADGLTGLGLTLAAIGISTLQDLRQGVPIRLFAHQSATDDHRHLVSMTGPGTIRMDRARTDRLPFRIYAPHYRTDEQHGGFLIDAPFVIDVPNELPLGTHIELVLNAHLPAGTSITPTLYDADTGVALLRSGLIWLTNPNQRRYFAGFQFSSGAEADPGAGEQTPVLWGYTVYVGPVYATTTPTTFTTARLKSVNVTGPGVSSQEETAGVSLEDEVDEAGLLRFRDQVRSKLVIVNRNTGVPISTLFEGQSASPESTLSGNQDGALYPSAEWHTIDGRFAGLWPRLWRQFHASMPFSFANSNNSPHPLATTEGLGWAPWRLTDILRWAFNQAGVPDAQLDIPDSPLRLPAGLSADDYAIMPGTPYGKFIEEIPKDYLGQLLIRDPNCGALDTTGVPTGMWRLLPNPNLTGGGSNFLAVIDLDAPPYTGVPYFVMAEGARGNGVWPVLKGSWRSYPKAPEGNMVVCKRPAGNNTDEGAKLLQSDLLVNFASFDPTSPDWLEGEKILILRVFDSFVTTLGMLNVAARIIYDRACFGERWFEAVIPLALVTDPLDTQQVQPRALRINDQIGIKRSGVIYPAVLRSGNPIIEYDDYQKIHLEGRLLNAGDALLLPENR